MIQFNKHIMTDNEKINKFIKDNNLDFSGYGSELNSALTIIVGYSLWQNIDLETLQTCLFPFTRGTVLDNELISVYDSAKRNNYGKWWDIETNRKKYVI